MKPEYTPVILQYDDNGITIEDIPEFIRSINELTKEVKKQYPNQKVKLYFIPEGLVAAMENSNATN